MANNPNDRPNQNKNAAPLFAGGLFGSANMTSAPGLFGNAPTGGTSLFGLPSSNTPTSSLFSPLGQQTITPLFGSGTGLPHSAPGNLQASKAGVLLGGLGTSTLASNEGEQQKKLTQSSTTAPPLGLFSQNAPNAPPSVFGQPKQQNTQENQLSSSSAPANPSSASTNNPITMSFGSGEEGKKEGVAKKQQAPSLFGGLGGQPGSLFEGITQTAGFGLFGQPSKAPEEKKDEKKQAPGSLFGNISFSSPPVLPKKTEAPAAQPIITQSSQNVPVKNEQKTTPKAETLQNPLPGSLFGVTSPSPSSALFGVSPSASASSSSLFGGMTSVPAKTQAPAFTSPVSEPSLFKSPDAKQPSLFRTSAYPSFLGTQIQAPTVPPTPNERNQPTLGTTTTLGLFTQNVPKVDLNTQKEALINAQSQQQSKSQAVSPNQPKLAAPSFVNNNKKQTKPAPPVINQQKQSKMQTTDPPSLFTGNSNLGNGLFGGKTTQQLIQKTSAKPQLATVSQPKPVTEVKQLDLPSLSERKRKQPVAQLQQPQTMRSNQSDTRMLTKQKAQNDFTTRDTKGTAQSSSSTVPFSFLKPKENINNDQLLDFKILKEQQKSDMFSTFLSQSSKQIIQSVKMYFTVRTEQFKPRQYPPNCTEKERFLTDFTNLFARVLGLTDHSWRLASQFLKRILAEQRYEKSLFNDGLLCPEYFRNHNIYQVSLGQAFYLNETGSRQLGLLLERMANMWNVERMGVLNFLLKYTDLMRRPSDLFVYLFKYLLQNDFKLIQTNNQSYRTFVRDCDYIAKRKLLEVISYYNSKQKDFKLVPSQQLKNIVKLIQNNQDENLNETSLKVLLNGLNFKQPKQIEVFELIRQTKSRVMTPLRSLAHKLSTRRTEFVPPPKELYQYIRGDEWIDWFDIYLSDSGREGVELQSGEPEQILQCLCTMSSGVLLKHMLGEKKGLLRLFHLLRDENMVSLYYRLLEACIYNEKSIAQVDEFYFRKMHFNLEYQEVIQYVIGFNEQMVPHPNEEAILAVLQAKLSLLAKIIELSPQRLVQLERYLFYHDYNRHKKFKNNTPQEFTRAEGEKLIHLFIDTINIVSLKGISNRLLHRIFRVIAHLLRSQHTHSVVLTVLRTNRPSFAFLNSSIHHLTLQALNQLLEEVLSGPYLHDLVCAYAQAREDELRAEGYYPFRYRDAQVGNLLRHEAGQGQKGGQLLFSIYWMNQLVKVMAKQRFNPYLLLKLLEKMHIEPQSDSSITSTPLYQKKSTDNRVPTIFEPIISTLNELPIWQDIGRVLECRIVRSEGKLQLKNKLYLNEPSPDTARMLLWSLKLVRLAFRLSALITKGEQSASNHFAVRTLSAVNFISRGKIGSQFSTNTSRNKLLSAVLALLSIESPQPVEVDISWEAEQSEEQDTVYHALIKYINCNKRTLDFQQATNFLKRPNNHLYEAQHSIVALSLEVLLQVIRLSPDTSLEQNITAYLPLKEEQHAQMKAEIMGRLSSAISAAINDPQIEHRAINFIYELKYEAGINKLHKSLSNRLFEEFIHCSPKRQRSCSFNAMVCKYLLRELEGQNYGYQAFTQQFLQGMASNMKFRDSFLRDYYEFKDSRDIGKMVRGYHSKEHSLLNLNQLQRMVQERAIVQIGKQWQTLVTAVQVLMVQLVRRKHSQGLLNCLTLFNQLILNNHLILLEQDLPDASRTLPLPISSYPLPISSYPRLYLRDPLETYTAQGGANRMATAQLQQKNNIVQWLIARGRALSEKVTSYVKFILTIDRYLYANNPVTYSMQRPEVAPLDLFCHLSLGRINFTASQLFGKNSSDATDTVQGIASNLLNRLAQMVKREHQLQTFSEAVKLFGYCLQWLRGKEKYGQTASHYLIRKLQKNIHFLLPASGMLITAESIKVLMSALSMGEKHFSAESRAQVRDAVYDVGEKYWGVLQRGFGEEERAIGQLFQQAVTILILLPPQKNQAFAFELLCNIWVRERNYQFFFNQSRVVLELARIAPEELVKLQLLTRCEIIVPLAARYSRYSDEQRRFDGIAWAWAVRIGAELANHPLSILVVSEVSSFLKKYHERIVELFQPGERLSKSYLQDLQAALQLLACLFAHDLWVNLNRKLAEWLTYLLSHKLIKLFVMYAQGKLPFAVLSGNDRALSSVKYIGADEQSLDSLTQENVFATEMRIRVNYCLRNYCLLMRRAFKASHYVQSYFQSPLQDTTRYFSSFWDSFNKQLITLFVYACKQFKVWSGQRKLNETLATVGQCTSAPHSFVQNGYLCTVLDLPRNDYELFSDLYLLNYLVADLAALHLLKERLYVGKFNSLMSTHTDAFGKRVREHIEAVRVESRKVNVDMGQYIGEAEFNAVVELIQSTKSK